MANEINDSNHGSHDPNCVAVLPTRQNCVSSLWMEPAQPEGSIQMGCSRCNQNDHSQNIDVDVNICYSSIG